MDDVSLCRITPRFQFYFPHMRKGLLSLLLVPSCSSLFAFPLPLPLLPSFSLLLVLFLPAFSLLPLSTLLLSSSCLFCTRFLSPSSSFTLLLSSSCPFCTRFLSPSSSFYPPFLIFPSFRQAYGRAMPSRVLSTIK